MWRIFTEEHILFEGLFERISNCRCTVFEKKESVMTLFSACGHSTAEIAERERELTSRPEGLSSNKKNGIPKLPSIPPKVLGMDTANKPCQHALKYIALLQGPCSFQVAL